MIKLKDILNEDRFDQSKMFDNSTVQKIANEIKKMIKYKDDYNASFEYKEFRFGDGTGGFSFNWEHSRHKGGNWGISLRKNSDHEFYCRSWYDKKYSGKDNLKAGLKSKAKTWKDFTNADLLQLWKRAKPMIAKNEKSAQAYLDKDAKAQSDYYGAKAKTGRIGYGLTSQPRR
jgi:hypothetical protein